MSKNTINTYIASSPVWTSTLIVQGTQRINVSIRCGSVVADPVLSYFSGIVTLQRQFGDDALDFWRDVEIWSVTKSEGMAGSIEECTTMPEAETVTYRIGVKTGAYYSVGSCNVRLGTT